MARPVWKDVFEGELHRAESAREAGNEGQARVCARRAAGIAIREHLIRAGGPLAQSADSTSAFDLLEMIRTQPDLTPAARQSAERLVQPVEPGGVFPAEIDLVAEARSLAEQLGLMAPGSPDPGSLPTV